MDNVRQFNPRDTADEHAFTRTPPNDTEAEQTVLGSCMEYPRLIAECSTRVTGASFYRPAHETIWNALADLAAAGAPTDPLAVRVELERRKALDRVGEPPVEPRGAALRDREDEVLAFRLGGPAFSTARRAHGGVGRPCARISRKRAIWMP